MGGGGGVSVCYLGIGIVFCITITPITLPLSSSNVCIPASERIPHSAPSHRACPTHIVRIGGYSNT